MSLKVIPKGKVNNTSTRHHGNDLSETSQRDITLYKLTRKKNTTYGVTKGQWVNLHVYLSPDKKVRVACAISIHHDNQMFDPKQNSSPTYIKRRAQWNITHAHNQIAGGWGGGVSWFMMTSSNENILRVTGYLWRNLLVTGVFPVHRPVTRSFGVFFILRLKQSFGWWFEMLSR